MKARDHHAGAAGSVLLGIVTARRWAGYSNAEDIPSVVRQLKQRGYKIRAWYKNNPRGEAAWRRVEQGITLLKYFDLEVLQYVTTIPSGTLLLATHFTSLLRDGRHADAVKFADGIARIAQLAKERATQAADPQGTLVETHSNEAQVQLLEEFFTEWSRCKYLPQPPRDPATLPPEQ